MRVLLLCGALLFAGALYGQVTFQAHPERTVVQVGEPFEVTFTFEGAATGVPTPEPRELTNLTLIGGPSSSTQTSIVNGRVSSSKSFTYVFRGNAPGPAVVGPVTVAYKGRNYSTNPQSITIVAGSETAKERGREEVFIEVIPDKREAFVGEQIVLTYKLYFSANIYAPEIKELPKATGFWTEEFELPNQLVPRDEVVGGQSYKSIVFRKAALFATTAGELSVDPLIAVVQVERRQSKRRGADPFFDDPFFSFGRRREAVQVSSRALKLKINPLPDAGRPPSDVAVGAFSVAARVDKQQVETNDAVTLTVQLRGVGNIKTAPSPQISFPTDFETFEPKTTDQIKRGPDKVSGSKTFEYVILPRAAGTQTIPPINYSYFDPESRRYEVAATPPITIDVARGSGRGGEGALPFEAKREVKSIGQDIAYVKPVSGEFVPLGSLPHHRTGVWMMLGGTWVLYAGLMMFAARREQAGLTLSARRRRALKAAHALLSTADTLAKQQKHPEATRALIQAVHAVLAEWTGLPAATHTSDEWKEEWSRRGYNADHWTALKSALDIGERSRYAGGQLSTQLIGESLADVRRVLQELEAA